MSPIQGGDDLDVACLREHIERLEEIEPIAASGQTADIPGLRRGIAGDVDDSLRTQRRHPFEDPLPAAVTRRIKDDQVGLHAG